RPGGNSGGARYQAERPPPAEAVLGAAARAVLAGGPARPAQPVQRLEHAGIVDLALVGLAARRHCGDLNMTDQRQVLFEAGDQVPADDLDMIEIELDLHIGPADSRNEIGGMLDAREE